MHARKEVTIYEIRHLAVQKEALPDSHYDRAGRSDTPRHRQQVEEAGARPLHAMQAIMPDLRRFWCRCRLGLNSKKLRAMHAPRSTEAFSDVLISLWNE